MLLFPGTPFNLLLTGAEELIAYLKFSFADTLPLSFGEINEVHILRPKNHYHLYMGRQHSYPHTSPQDLIPSPGIYTFLKII